MRTFPHVQMRSLMEGATEAKALFDNKQFDEAAAAYNTLLAKLSALGLKSPFLWWHLAIALDYSGKVDHAFEACLKSVNEDPLYAGPLNSFDIICSRLHERLLELVENDPRIPKWFGMLSKVGRVELDARLLMVRHLSAVGKAAEALRQAEALTLLFEDSQQAWQTLAALARDAGLAERAAEAEATAQALGGITQ